MGNIFSNKSFTSRYFSAPKSTGPALSPKQKKTFDGADGSKPNNKIEGSEVKAVSQPAKMQEKQGPARRDLSKKETRLSNRLDKAKDQEHDAWEKEDGGKKEAKKQDRKERKVLRVEQKLDKEKRKQSRKKFGLEKDPHKKEIRQSNKQERKDLKAKQKRFEERRKEKESGPAKTVEELKQKKKDMQLGKHRVKPGGDPKNVKKFNKKIGRINKRIDNKS